MSHSYENIVSAPKTGTFHMRINPGVKKESEALTLIPKESRIRYIKIAMRVLFLIYCPKSSDSLLNLSHLVFLLLYVNTMVRRDALSIVRRASNSRKAASMALKKSTPRIVKFLTWMRAKCVVSVSNAPNAMYIIKKSSINGTFNSLYQKAISIVIIPNTSINGASISYTR